MRQELDHELCEKYPKIFRDRHAPMTQTAMCWGFDCGDGWYNIINALCFQIQSYIDWKNSQRQLLLTSNPYDRPIPDEVPQVVATQVKEKFGTLRFYWGGHGGHPITINIMDDIVYAAEIKSAYICEECGKYGELRTGGWWIKTLCGTHAEEQGY